MTLFERSSTPAVLTSRRQALKFGLGAATVLAGLSVFRSASAMGVTPFSLELGKAGKGLNGTFTVENNFTDPLPVEIRIQQLDFNVDGVVETNTDPGDLAVFPVQAVIPPGQSRVFRVQYVGTLPSTASRHYYVTAAQVPVAVEGADAQVQVVYAFNILVSVPVPGVKADIKLTGATIGLNQKKEPEAILTLQNSAISYGYFKNGSLKLTQKDASGKVIFQQSFSPSQVEQVVGLGLIGPQQTRNLMFAVPLPSADGTLTAEYKYVGG